MKPEKLYTYAAAVIVLAPAIGTLFLIWLLEVYP